jgi:hypothetical protein
MVWIIEPWRGEAVKRFPQYSLDIQECENIDQLWDFFWELINAGRGLKNSQPIIKAIEDYAVWCFSESGDAAAINGVMQCYYCELTRKKITSPDLNTPFPKECVNLLTKVIKDILKD